MDLIKLFSRAIIGLGALLGLLVSALAVASSVGNANAEISSEEEAPLHVVASILPLQMLVQDLTQDILPAHVEVLVPRNSSPHNYQLTPKSAFGLRNADFVVWLGASAEPYLQKAISQQKNNSIATLNLPAMHLRHYNESSVHQEARHKANLESLAKTDSYTDSDHDHEEHAHKGIDPHFWWSVQHLDVAALALVSQLSQLRPKAAPKLRERYTQWIAALRQQRQPAREQLKGNSAGVLSYHDSLFYLQLDLERQLQPTSQLMSQPDLKPGARQLIELRKQVQEQKLQCLILEPGSSLAWIAKIDPDGLLSQVTIDPLGWDVEIAEGSRIAAMLRSAYHKLAMCMAKKQRPPKS